MKIFRPVFFAILAAALVIAVAVAAREHGKQTRKIDSLVKRGEQLRAIYKP